MAIAAIFDLDGVLIESRALACESLIFACREAKLDAPDLPRFLELMGLPLELILNRLNLPPVIARDFRAYASENVHLVEPFPSALDMLVEARSRGALVAVLTGKDRARAEALLTRFGMNSHLDILVTPQDAPPKPEPGSIETILDSLAASREGSFYVGDSRVDMATARNSSVTAVFAAWGAVRELAASEYDLRIHAPEQIGRAWEPQAP